MPTPAAKSAPAPQTPATVPAEEQNIINQQLILLSTQAVLVRDLEDQLAISPPGPVQPIPPLPAGTDLVSIMANQAASIRTQAAYIQHLQDRITLQTTTATATPVKMN